MRGVGLAAALAALLAGCALGARPAALPAPSPAQPPVTYVAIGASETVGIGTQEPTRESFPQRLLHLIGPPAVLYNFGIPGETTRAALQDELPGALSVHPTLATVWLNVDDLVASVQLSDYEARLGQLVHALRGAGARVLLANTPRLDRLPAYAACRPNPPPGSVQCPLGSVVLPAPEQVEAMVGSYNAAIAAVAAREGAALVDLFAAGAVSAQHPEYIGRDGFHPSAAGASAIARTFAAALGIEPSPAG